MTSLINFNLSKWMPAIIPGSILAFIAPNIPFILVCIFAVLVDSITAWCLARRIKKKSGKANAKFESRKFGKIIISLIEVMLVIFLASMLETHVLTMFDKLYLANYVAAIYVIKQAISILENISSQNNKSWAVLLQKILIDKSERHLNVDVNNDGKISGNESDN